MALNTVSSDRLSTNVKTSNLGTELKKKVGQNKNIIINGAMQVAQRGTSMATGDGYAADRFRLEINGTDENPTLTQADVVSGTTPYTLGFRKSWKVQNGNQTSGAGATDRIQMQYRFEAQDIANSGWNYTSSSSFVTLSFWVKSSVAQTFYGLLFTSDGTSQNYPFETGSLSADTWTKITKTIPGNSNLTFNNDNGEGLKLELHMLRGTDYTSSGVTLNQWATYASGTRTPDQTTTWYTTDNATFEVTGMQLEVGSVATDFEHRSFAEELALCQRYYFRIPYQGVSNGGGVYLGSGKETGSNARVAVDFPVPMRAIPSCAASNLLADDETSATSANTVAGVLASSVEPDRGRIEFSGGSYSSGNSISLATSQATDSYLEGSAELS